MICQVVNAGIDVSSGKYWYKRVGTLKLVNDDDRTDHLNHSWLVILDFKHCQVFS